MKLTIKKLEKFPFKGQYGDTERFVITFAEKPNQTVSAFKNRWCQDWKVGDQVEIANEQINKVEKNGKTYVNLKAPASARGNFAGFDILKKQVDNLVKDMAKVKKEVADIKSNLGTPKENIVQKASEEIKKEDDKININEISF